MIYKNIAYVQGERAGKILDLIRKGKIEAAKRRLLRDHAYGIKEELEGTPWHGSSDETIETSRSIFSWNHRGSYVGYEKKIKGD